MKKDDEVLKSAEEFVRKALSQTSKDPVKESTIRSVARKVSKAIPPKPESETAQA